MRFNVCGSVARELRWSGREADKSNSPSTESLRLHSSHRENLKSKLSLEFTINILRQDREVSFERSSDALLFDCPK